MSKLPIIHYSFPNQGPLSGEPYFPGDGGYPPRPGEDRPGLSPFGRLAKGGAYGKSVTFRYNADSTNPIQMSNTEILRLEGDDLDACQLVVTLDPPKVQPVAFENLAIDFEAAPTNAQSAAAVAGENFPGSEEPIAWPLFEAVVRWGVGGAQREAIVDFTQGTQFSVVASFIEIFAIVSQGADVGADGTSAGYLLNGQVGPGYSRENARKTVFTPEIGSGVESDVFNIPAYARRAYLLGRDAGAVPTTPTGYVRFWRTPDGVAGGKSAGQVLVTANQPGAFDVPNGAAYFSIYNQGDDMPFAAVFELALA